VRAHLLPTIVLLAVPLPAHAEAPAASSVPAISEAELLAKLTADPRLVRIAATIDSARADVVAAGLRPNPSVSYEREEVFPDGGVATNYLRFSLPLEISGRRSARRDAARTEVAAVAAEGDGARFALSMHALRAFRTAAYERARIELLRAERAALANAVEIVRKRTSAGTASGYDLQRIQLELAAYDDLIAAATTQLAIARLELGALAGVPDGIDAAGSFETPPDPPALDALLGDTFTKRPDVRAAAARREGAQALARSARRSWIPDLTLQAGFMTQDVDPDTTAKGYTAGLALSLPIFDHGQADAARARAQQRAADAERDVLARTVPVAIRSRHQALLQTIGRARTVARDQLARLDQLLRSAETAYREGGGNVVELVDAYTTARDTRLRDLELRRDARLAEIDLWIALWRRP
jgi:cobalt-zinc-cadmium efflux system outer membrane protein